MTIIRQLARLCLSVGVVVLIGGGRAFAHDHEIDGETRVVAESIVKSVLPATPDVRRLCVEDVTNACRLCGSHSLCDVAEVVASYASNVRDDDRRDLLVHLTRSLSMVAKLRAAGLEGRHDVAVALGTPSTKRVTGAAAIDYAAEHGLELKRYAHVTDGASVQLPLDQARETAPEDANLIYLDLPAPASTGEAAHMEGLRLLYTDTRYDALERFAHVLEESEEPDLRLSAGRLVKLVTLMRGPSSGCDAIAKNLLVDRDPRVALRFSRDALDMRTPAVLTRMAERIKDRRILPKSRGFLWASPGELGNKIWRNMTVRKIIVPPSTWLTGPFDPSPEELASVVEQVRTLGAKRAYRPVGKGWTCVSDTVVVTKVGEVQDFQCDGGKGTLTVTAFGMSLRDNVPRTDARMDLTIVTKDGTSRGLSVAQAPEEDLFVHEVLHGVGIVCRAMFVPNLDGSLRIRLHVWCED